MVAVSFLSGIAAPTASAASNDDDAPVLQEIELEDVGRTKVEIEVEFDEPVTGWIDYGRTRDYGDRETTGDRPRKEHDLKLTDLEPGAEYHYSVVAFDEDENRVTIKDRTFTTKEPEPTATPKPEPTATPKPEPTATPKPEPTASPKSEPDPTPRNDDDPTIVSLQVSDVTETSAVVQWTVDEPTTGKVSYGLDADYSESTGWTDDLSTDHEFTLTDLNAGDEYHFKVVSSDVDGNRVRTGDATFSTHDGPEPRTAPETAPETTPDQTLEPTATPEPTPEPPTATPEPTSGPADPPSGAHCTDEGIIGWGDGTTGGAGGDVVVVKSASALASAIKSSQRPLTIRVDVSSPQTWNLGQVTVSKGDLTVEGDQDVVFRGTQFLVKSSNVILRSLHVGTGDADLNTAEAQDFEPFTVNGNSNSISRVVLQCVVGIWGPDIGGLAVLGDSSDVTVQDSIFGEGLYLSKHPEGTPAEKGHSYAVNVSRGDTSKTMQRVTIARNLIVRSEGRMPKITGGRNMELVNNLIVGWGSRAPEGNAESLHVVGNYLVPTSASTELLVWSPRMQGADPVAYASSVWLKGNVLQGSGGDELRGGPEKVYRSGSAFTPTHAAMSAADARGHVLANAGGPDRSAWVKRIIDDVEALKSSWYSGQGQPGLNPSWD